MEQAATAMATVFLTNAIPTAITAVLQMIVISLVAHQTATAMVFQTPAI